MRPNPDRGFRLGDAMVIIAAITPGLVLIRIGLDSGVFKVGTMHVPNGQRPSLARQIVEFVHFGGGCLLAGLVPAVLILGLYRAHPSRREAAQGPGLVACIVAVAASILPILGFAWAVFKESRSTFPTYSLPFNIVFGRWIMAAGPMILGAWIVLVIQGRWRPRPTWADRAGCLMGAVFGLVFLHREIDFDLIEPISLWWKG